MPDAPAVEVNIVNDVASQFAASSTANWFVAGVTERGPSDAPFLVRGLGAAKSIFGERLIDSPLMDALETFFAEGGESAYVARIVGPETVSATGTLVDGEGSDVLEITATSAGEWANDVHLVVAAGGTEGTFVLTVLDDGATVESSPELTDLDEAVAWAASSQYVRLVKSSGASADPDEQDVTLAGGDDDHASIDSTSLTAALDLFTSDYGAGQVTLPGYTTSTAYAALLAHAHATKRVAKLDAVDSATAATVVSSAVGLRGTDGHRLSGIFAPWDVIPGLAPGTSRTVPPSARAAALHARILAEGGTVGDPTAGARWPARFVNGLSQSYSPTDQGLLNDAGVNVSILRRQEILVNGNRTLTSVISEPNWAQLSAATVIAAIAAEGAEIGEQYQHVKADARNHKLFEFVSLLKDMCRAHYDEDDLYGETFEDACTVTPAVEVTGASASLLANIEARVVEGADNVVIAISKTPNG